MFCGVALQSSNDDIRIALICATKRCLRAKLPDGIVSKAVFLIWWIYRLGHPLRSPRKLSIYPVQSHIYRIKVSKKILNLILKTKSLVKSCCWPAAYRQLLLLSLQTSYQLMKPISEYDQSSIHNITPEKAL